MNLRMNLGENSYDIIVEKGALLKIDEYLDLNRKVLIVTDSGVPCEYARYVLEKAKEGYVFSFEQGEKNKSMETFTNILSMLVDCKFTRTDCVVAVGGGVCGDMAGFAASCYMRGIDFYNIPTTLLSQVDSSIGGKCAIDFMGVKNIVGSFYQPKKVVIDPNTLNTLDDRLFNEGLVEAFKMAACFNKELFERIENSSNIKEEISDVIVEALKIKKDVVEQDPKEKSLRKVLNYGHTIGHAIEAASNNLYYHGECVGMGMLYASSDDVSKRIYRFLKKYNLPVKADIDSKTLLEYASHDKKLSGSGVTFVRVDNIGSYELVNIKFDELKLIIEGDPYEE